MKTGISESGMNLTHERFSGLMVPVPPIDVQRRIVAKLDELLAQSRAAREQLEAVPALVEQYRQSVLAAAFRGDLTADWRKKNPDVEPASKLLERIGIERRQKWEAAELAKLKAKGKSPKDDTWKSKYAAPVSLHTDADSRLPSLWALAELEELVFSGPTNGFSPPSTGEAAGPLALKLTATTSGSLRLDDAAVKRLDQPVANDANAWLEPGDLLIQRANTLEYVGAAAIFDGPSKTYVYPDLMMRVRVTDPVTREYLWRFLNSRTAREFFRANATGTAGSMPKITGEVVRRLRVPLPPLAEQRMIVDALKVAIGSTTTMTTNSTSLQESLPMLERSLLAKAFRGELVS